jgi:hypothetical protein
MTYEDAAKIEWPPLGQTVTLDGVRFNVDGNGTVSKPARSKFNSYFRNLRNQDGALACAVRDAATKRVVWEAEDR